MKKLLFISVLILTLLLCNRCKEADKFKHFIAAIEQDRFHGWPANNGVWQWEDEILVGFTQGDFTIKQGHNISGKQKSLFARSRNGGENWEMFDPENFMDDENEKFVPLQKNFLDHSLDLKHSGFAMRIFSSGYHGNEDPEGGFYYSFDRGATWQGPYFLGKINQHKELKDKNITARNDYIVTDKNQAFFFISACPKSQEKANRIACIKTEDGGMNFEFISWVTPPVLDINAVMSSTVQISKDKFIMAYRKIYHENIESLGKESPYGEKRKNTIDIHISEDGCLTWNFLSTVKVMESGSNPPALLLLNDGRLLCVYGDRHNLIMAGRYSNTEGKTWENEFVIRENLIGTSDFGYPRLAQRKDGKLAAMYYWSSPEDPQEHIAVTIWDPNKQ